ELLAAADEGGLGGAVAWPGDGAHGAADSVDDGRAGRGATSAHAGGDAGGGELREGSGGHGEGAGGALSPIAVLGRAGDDACGGEHAGEAAGAHRRGPTA